VISDIQNGRSYPLGATVRPGGTNFSVYSKSATSLELLLFDSVDSQKPSRVITFDPSGNRTFHYWHAFVPGISSGQLYAFRAKGPFEPERGLRFDGDKVLLDPYGRGVAVGDNYDRQAASTPGDNAAYSMKSVTADPRRYDWEGDTPLNRPFSQTVIYELHVGGFTRHPSSGISPEKRGTYAGLAEKIPYLKELGITAVELLPVQQYDEYDAPGNRVNYWGYSPIGFFSPHSGYSSRKDPVGPLDEFRDMVKALHRAGIEVILDVVYNHTAEGSHLGPTLSFRGLENSAYYILERNQALYANFSGCGNTLNGNYSIARRMIIHSLQYWVREMHVDGFRFDLASVLSRDEYGHPLKNPPILWSIETDPVLAGTKIIAEAWDAAGLYQVGSFVGDRWTEWNGRFRDDVRAFIKGDNGTSRKFSSRILGSPDIYSHEAHEPHRSINFVTCHDGFTLNDLVSYNRKHNLANGEDNRDGSDSNLSWNCGVEGPTDDPEVESLRNRQVKNALAILMLSLGTPMLLMGDEVRRTQQGNNNVYCQNNELSWLDWNDAERHPDILRFVRELVRFRNRHETLRVERFWTLSEIIDKSHIKWHGLKLGEPDWGDNSHSLALTLRSAAMHELLHVMFNSYWEPLTFKLPHATHTTRKGWSRIMDTALKPPEDFSQPELAQPLQNGNMYRVEPRSVVLLMQRVKAAPRKSTVNTTRGAQIINF
jgi:glycogen operon protein